MKNFFSHDTAVIDDGSHIGDGTKIWHWSHISSGAHIGTNCTIGQNVYIASRVTIGNNVKIQNNVSVYDDVIIEDDVFCGPSMVFTNVINPRAFIERKDEYKQTLIKKGASIGANATVVCGNTIGSYSFIGAGSLVTKDVKDFSLCFGIPAQHKYFVSISGDKLDTSSYSGEKIVLKQEKERHEYLFDGEKIQLL